jgi:hypothetical protein
MVPGAGIRWRRGIFPTAPPPLRRPHMLVSIHFMKIKNLALGIARLFVPVVLVLAFVSLANAASWSGIEPYRSTRDEVVKILGQPVLDQMDVDGSLHFHVVGGTAVISFVDAKFATAKKLSSRKIGTVKQIVLQHEGGTDTPESLNLKGNNAFQREENNGVVVYRNLKEGVAYTFIAGVLRTTYYFPAGGQLPKTQA